MEKGYVERLERVLDEKSRFIKRLLDILETTYPNASLTHLPIDAWDAIEDGEYVPPHAHLMMLIESAGFKRDRDEKGWHKDNLYIPLWWVWGTHPHDITQDASRVLCRLIEATRESRSNDSVQEI
jgi:hypothetical protein